jgi:hypothetical protein
VKYLLGIQLALFIVLEASIAQAWNLNARYVNALRFDKNGQIFFTLFESGQSGSEFKCQGNQQWFQISACSANDQACIESVNRMASMLLAAKLAGRPVHVQRTNCLVTEIALKP